jgi:hypothetical protein
MRSVESRPHGGDYVRLAGLDDAADASAMFILRADGTVSSANDGAASSASAASEAGLEPGDAVVVPSQLDYETWGKALVRNLKDWSQIFYQFGLGAAAIQTLRTATDDYHGRPHLDSLRQPALDAAEDQALPVGLVDVLTWIGEGKRLSPSRPSRGGRGADVRAAADAVYTARTALLPPPSSSRRLAAALVRPVAPMSGLACPAATEVARRAVRGRSSRATASCAPWTSASACASATGAELRSAAQEHAADVRVSADKKSGLITVEVDDPDPSSPPTGQWHYEEMEQGARSRLAVSEPSSAACSTSSSCATRRKT